VTTLAVPARAARSVLTPLLAVVVVGCGHVLRVSRLAVPFVPGVGGAAGFSVALGEVAGHVFGHGLALWVALLTGSVFLLAMDRQIPLRRNRDE
jgi:hypothetical protein